MESADLEMEDIFDGGGDVNEDIGGQAPMPDFDADDDEPMRLAEAEDAENQEGEGEGEVLNKLRDLSKGAAKKRVMRPQPKLNEERLSSDRGLPILPIIFEDVKFKGKGHEHEDLRKMMGKLEHWAHRLFPKMPFDEFIARMEKLGNKRGVKTCLNRIRLDMPILDADFTEQQQEENKDEDEEGDGEAAMAGVFPNDEIDDADAEEAFEEMLRQEREKRAAEGDVDAGIGTSGGGSQTPKRKDSSRDDPKTPAAPPSPSTPAVPKTPATPGSITDEQKERMERNKRLAMEKRMAKLGKSFPTSSQQASQPKQKDGHSHSAEDTQKSQTLPSMDTLEKDVEAEVSKAVNENIAVTENTEDLHLQLSETQGKETDAPGSDSLHLEIQTDSATIDNEVGTDNGSVVTKPNGANSGVLDKGCLQLTDNSNNTEVNLQLSNITVSEENSERPLVLTETDKFDSLNLHLTEEDSDIRKDRTSAKDSNDINLCLSATENINKDSSIIPNERTTSDSHQKSKTSDSSDLKLNLSISDTEDMAVDEATFDDSVVADKENIDVEVK